MRRASTPLTCPPRVSSSGCSCYRSATVHRNLLDKRRTICYLLQRHCQANDCLPSIRCGLENKNIALLIARHHSKHVAALFRPLGSEKVRTEQMKCPPSSQEHAGFRTPVNIGIARSLKCTCKRSAKAAKRHIVHLQHDCLYVKGQHAVWKTYQTSADPTQKP